ncbi:hypothetical protein LCGC14_2484380 [marine sediment metagenome]|uniref:Uncharacterized protein n=1 Tax=marine sediment metagenome TaxID=412755 RepID=A0A0F9B7C3_9ZZZZ
MKILDDGQYACDECVDHFDSREANIIRAAVYYVPADGDDLLLIDVCEEHYQSTYGSNYPKEDINNR